MKLVSAVMVPHRFTALQDALRTFGVHGLTVSEVFDRDDHLHCEVYRGRRFARDLGPHVRLDVLTADEDADDLVRIIDRVVGGQVRLWVTPVDAVVRVRTGQRGADAL